MARKKRRTKLKKKSAELVDAKLVKALNHPLRARALSILNERTASPKEIAGRLGKDVGNVSYHIRRLEKLGCIELVRTKQRRGATEHYYRGITRSFLNDANWARLSSEAKNGVSVAGLKMQNEASLKALEAGTFDSRADRHLSCTPMDVDEEGWGELTELLAKTLEEVIEIHSRSAERMAQGTPSFRATVSILGFESPTPEPEQ